MLKQLAHGVFGWDRQERTSLRYGRINIADRGFVTGCVAEPSVDAAVLRELSGIRVRLVARVVETRTSTHVGDRGLNIYPSTPDVGEEVVLGVGVLDSERNADGETAFLLRPGDGRRHFWVDPRLLYRLHNQTVDLFVEPTDEPFSLAPDLELPEPGAVSLGNGEFQTVGMDFQPGDRLELPSRVERIGEGMFAVTPAASPPEGQRVKVVKGR